MKKGLFILGTVLCMIIGCTFITHAEDYSEAEIFMSQIGVISKYDDGSFHSEYELSRGDFAIMLSRLIGFENEDGRDIFDDVSGKNASYRSVTYLYDHGIIFGDGDGNFRPDDTISGSETAQMLVTALGYKKKAELRGGSTAAYSSLAGEIGLKGLSAQKVTKRIAINALYDALTIDFYVQSYSDDKLYYDRAEGKNILSNVFKAEKREGLVIATHGLSIYGNYDIEEGHLVIDYKEYTSDIADLDSFTGCRVKYYIYKSDSINAGKVFAIIPDNESEITVVADDIDDGRVGSIKYTEGTKTKSVSISAEAFYSYNGAGDSAPTDEELNPESGSIRLIDNDGDNKYDVVIIWNYKDYKVKAATRDIITVEDSDYVIPVDDNNIRVYINGAESNAWDIKPESVISVAKSKKSSAGEITVILVSSESVSGMVTSYDEQTKTAVINSKEYKVSDNMNIISMVGKTSTFYLNSFGKIAFYDGNKEGMYGYVFNIYFNEDDEITYFKILSENGDVKLYEAAGDKILYSVGGGNGTRLLAKSLRDDKFLSENGFKKQLIKYSLNSENKVTKIIQAEKTNASTWNENIFCINVESSNPCKAVCVENTIYNENAWAEEMANVKQGVTKCFFVTNDEAKCQVGMINDICKSSDTRYPSMKIYDIDKYGFARIVVIETDSLNDVAMDIKTDYMVISNINTVVYDNVPTLQISGMGTKGNISLLCEDEELTNQVSETVAANKFTVSSLEVGDVIQYTSDMNGVLTAFRVVFDHKKADTPFYFGGGLKNDFYYIGDIIRTGKDGFVIDKGNDLHRGVIWCSNLNVYRYDKDSKNKIEKITKEDLYSGCRVFAFGRSSYNVLCVLAIE